MKHFSRRPALTILILACVSAVANIEKAVADIQYDGGELFALNCSNCHGTYGEGNGAVMPSLSVVLLDLRYLSARNGGEYPEAFVRQIIDGREVRAAHGPDGMPVWGAEFSRGEGLQEDAQARVQAKIAAIAEFLEDIQIVE